MKQGNKDGKPKGLPEAGTKENPWHMSGEQAPRGLPGPEEGTGRMPGGQGKQEPSGQPGMDGNDGPDGSKRKKTSGQPGSGAERMPGQKGAGEMQRDSRNQSADHQERTRSQSGNGKGDERRPGTEGRTEHVSQGRSVSDQENKKGDPVSRDHNGAKRERETGAAKAGNKADTSGREAAGYEPGNRRRSTEQRRPGAPNQRRESSIYRT